MGPGAREQKILQEAQEKLFIDIANKFQEVIMHYRNGKEAKNGDKVIQLDFSSGKIVSFGVLYDAVPGNDYCNGKIAPMGLDHLGACMCDCLRIEDLEAIIADKGLNKRPEDK